MNEVIYLVIGWLFGLLSPSIVERIQRKYRRADLTWIFTAAGDANTAA